MNWYTRDKKSPLERYVLSKEIPYTNILNKCKENPNTNNIEIQELHEKVNKRDTYRVYKGYLDYDKFLGEYISMYQRQHCVSEYVSERLESRGRIILDFDFEKNTSLYNQIKNVFRIDNDFRSRGLENFIGNLIYKSFHKLGYNQIANELYKPTIIWLSKGFYSDNTGIIRNVTNNVQAPPMCFISDCRDGKISYHVVLPVYSEQRHITTMYLIETMNMLLRNGDMGIQLGTNESFSDMNMAKEYQCIRLPGMYKYKSMSKLVLMDNSHFPYCVTSNVDGPLWIPEVWKIENIQCPSWIIQKNSNVEYEDIDDNPSKLWNRICLYPHCKCITDHYNGIQMKNNKYTLVPKDTNGEHYCPVCNATHDHIVPIINKKDNRIELGCYSMSHKSTKKSILIEYIDNGSNIENTIEKKNKRDEYIQNKINSWFGILHDIPSDIRMDKYEDKLCHPFPSPDTYKLLMVASPMGTGKTYQLRSYIHDHYNKTDDKILVISFRKTLGIELTKSIPSLCYYENDQEWMYYDRVVTTIESFHKWQYIGKKGYTVIIDEWESALMEMIGSTVKDSQVVLSAFEMICKNAANIIVLDAKLTWNTGGTFFELLGIGRDEMYVSWNTIKDNDIQEKKIMVYTDKDKFYTQLKNEPKDIKIDVRTTIHGRSMANKIKYMRNLHDDDEIALFMAKTTNKSIGVEDRYYQNGKVKVCISNQVDQAGVSFDREYYDVQYSYGSGLTSGFDGLLQMERRVRKHSRNEIHAFVTNSYQPIYKLSLSRFMEWVGYLDTIDYFRLSDDQKEWLKLSYKYKLILARLHVKRALSSMYYKEGYIYMHEKVHGYKVEVDTTGLEKKDMVDEYKSTIQSIKNENMEVQTKYNLDIHMHEKKLEELDTQISSCNDQNKIEELKQEQIDVKKELEDLESEKKDIMMENKNKIEELKSDMKQYIDEYQEENNIESIKVPKIQYPKWKDLIDVVEPSITDDVKKDIQKVEDQLRKLDISGLHPDLQKMFISDADELYYFYRCLERCGKDLKWKHAGNLYFHFWQKNKKENIICISKMKNVVTDRDKKYNEFREMGLSFVEAMNQSCPEMGKKKNTLAMVRFDNLIDLLRLGTITKNDKDVLVVEYKAGTQASNPFSKTIFHIEGSSPCQFLNSKLQVVKDIWKRINIFLYEYYGFKNEWKEVNRLVNGTRIIYHQYTIQKESSLIDMEFLYNKIM